ncbi:MAG: Inositol 2-dehydrogenase/D-chiro-inositol 3-dehydrogenase [Verrucomicrobiae bacterium]|nr:Inositol 2-dehydrogenase/D-chiro-inositol 3-dehydrogenase [Verrucomicrobiae bacterium]
MKPISILCIGAGGRGTTYCRFAKEQPTRVQVVGVAEPRDFFRDRLEQTHAIPAAHVFRDWREAARQPRLADAVIIATQDAMHVEPVEAFAQLGYHILLEKPMAPTAADCRRIVAAVKRHRVMLAVCHVMRYTAYSQRLKALLTAGAIGDIVSVQHLEPVGYWHQAHSFVRGNWRNTAESSCMLLAKSCHDLDWLRYMIDAPCRAVSSFGALKHFRKAEKPAAAGPATRCLDCAFEPECPYSARKIYGNRLAQGQTGWPVDVVAPNATPATLEAALRSGPYGRCVYECDNDVVDHQVVNLLFAGNRTASFTMTAFNSGGHRQTRLFGTRGMLEGDGVKIHHTDFLTDKTTEIDTETSADGSLLSGHGGGDFGLMDSFVRAVAANDPTQILSGPDETLESHLMVFAAEQARLENRVIEFPAA